ncbi:MAG: hypothetical protein ACLVHV_15620 [Oscillospiraceae bacterium]
MYVFSRCFSIVNGVPIATDSHSEPQHGADPIQDYPRQPSHSPWKWLNDPQKRCEVHRFVTAVGVDLNIAEAGAGDETA